MKVVLRKYSKSYGYFGSFLTCYLSGLTFQCMKNDELETILFDLDTRNILCVTADGDIYIRATALEEDDTSETCIAIVAKADWERLQAEFFQQKLAYCSRSGEWCGVESVYSQNLSFEKKGWLLTPPDGDWELGEDYRKEVSIVRIYDPELEMEHD